MNKNINARPHQTAKDRLEAIHSHSKGKDSPRDSDGILKEGYVELKPGEDISVSKSVQGFYDSQIPHMPDVYLALGVTSEELQSRLSKTLEPLPDVAKLPGVPELPGLDGLPDTSILKSKNHRGFRSVVERKKLELVKRCVWLHEDYDARKHGPQGEAKTGKISLWSHPLPLEQIVADTEFKNIRLEPEEGEIEKLAESMTSQGIKIPVTVVEAPNSTFFLRSGFRRVKAARRLGWTYIPAIILPLNTPKVSEYWSNIIENTARRPLYTYELAAAAHRMKDEFQISAKEFAKITCHDPGYIADLLRAFENLPPVILESWRKRSHVAVRDYIRWSYMTPAEALKEYYISQGLQHRKKFEQQGQMPGAPGPPKRPSGPIKEKTATERGLRRMEGLKFAIASCPRLDGPTRMAYLQIVCFCEGTRDTVPGIYDANARHRSTKGRDGKKGAEQPAEQPSEEDITFENIYAGMFSDDDEAK